jgi:hypothetical protein
MRKFVPSLLTLAVGLSLTAVAFVFGPEGKPRADTAETHTVNCTDVVDDVCAVSYGQFTLYFVDGEVWDINYNPYVECDDFATPGEVICVDGRTGEVVG